MGRITRGTTNPNRLRRQDRFLLAHHLDAVRAASPGAVVVDLGFGDSPVTVWELAARLAVHQADVRVFGVEIDPHRVHTAQQRANISPQAAPEVRFVHGGFDLPLPGAEGQPIALIRAANVLRQYEAAEVPAAWAALTSRLHERGVLLEGTCDEIGRLHSWVVVRPSGPESLTLAYDLRSIAFPSEVAARLPKVLIHRNTDGEKIHALLQSLDAVWAAQSAWQGFGERQRFIAMAQDLKSRGWPVLHGPKRWRLGEISFAWEAVDPLTGGD